MSPGLRSTSVPSSILIHAAVRPQQTWAENWGGCAPLGGPGSTSNTMWPPLGVSVVQWQFIEVFLQKFENLEEQETLISIWDTRFYLP